MQLTFELISVVISDTFCVANPPILIALCVAWDASFDADEENIDHPYNYLITILQIQNIIITIIVKY
jgi:hypothetical protein